jgi:hypothetical protein
VEPENPISSELPLARVSVIEISDEYQVSAIALGALLADLGARAARMKGGLGCGAGILDDLEGKHMWNACSKWRLKRQSIDEIDKWDLNGFGEICRIWPQQQCLVSFNPWVWDWRIKGACRSKAVRNLEP